jgi:hypothetical protein
LLCSIAGASEAKERAALHGSGGAAAIKVKADAARGGMTNNKNDPLSLLCSVGGAPRRASPNHHARRATFCIFIFLPCRGSGTRRVRTNFLMLNS